MVLINPRRWRKVRKTMAAIKTVLGERQRMRYIRPTPYSTLSITHPTTHTFFHTLCPKPCDLHPALCTLHPASYAIEAEDKAVFPVFSPNA
jgi:hypothetical protein